MSAQLLTLISGVILLLVFALVGWLQRRRRERHKPDRPEE